jgi:outer membrane protein OmpA-like peptidoglycan-associated protein
MQSISSFAFRESCISYDVMTIKWSKIALLSALSVLWLTGCNPAHIALTVASVPFLADETVGRGIDINPAEGGYKDVLAWEYDALSKYEQYEARRKDLAIYFRDKSKAARKHEFVPIPYVEDYPVPEFAKAEMEEARESLLKALNTAHTPQNERLIAMAQTRYDCWLVYSELLKKQGEYLGCRERFYEALASLKVPDSALTLHSVYFNSGRVDLSEEARATIAEIAGKFRNRPSWELVLSGYADAVGDRLENEILSMRRTISVKNALAQHGVHFDRIVIKAEGSRGSIPDTTDKNARRVDVTFSPRGIYDSDVQEMMERHGWGNLDEGDDH